MIKYNKIEWIAFQFFKKKVACCFDGRDRLTFFFNEPFLRKELYNALLYELNIPGGKQNKKIVNKYMLLASIKNLNDLVVNIKELDQSDNPYFGKYICNWIMKI